MRTQKELKETVQALKKSLWCVENVMYAAKDYSYVYNHTDEYRVREAQMFIDSVICYAEEIAADLNVKQLKHKRNNK